MSAKVKTVETGSIAQECGIAPGDCIVSINEETFSDILDYRFLVADEYLEVLVHKADGSAQILEIEKDYADDLGVCFENDLIDTMKSCRNRCIFCFIDQLPKGMRKTMYFKDDDARMSFLLGNYITMTNLSEEDLGRIIRMHISPVNVSVHTTDPALRRFMLHNKNAGDVLRVMKRLSDAGIEMNCQIVACPGVNDGAQLDRTLSDLSGLFPMVQSISVVPVGVTKYRNGLYPLEVYDQKSAADLVAQVHRRQAEFLKQYQKRYVYLADEFYLLADIPLPSYEEYEGFPQIENGVGLMASLREEFEACLAEKRETVKNLGPIHKTIACGTIIKAFMESLTQKIRAVNPAATVRVVAIKNYFFGETVTVSGLVCGCDLIEQLSGQALGSEVLISGSMLKADEDIFLDDVTLADVQKALGVLVTPVENNGWEFLQRIITA